MADGQWEDDQWEDIAEIAAPLRDAGWSDSDIAQAVDGGRPEEPPLFPAMPVGELAVSVLLSRLHGWSPCFRNGQP
jgi:hypothetical protein